MRVVTIANRLPVRRGDNGWELSPGGLVTALRPVMATHTGAWVGWDGGTRGIPATLPDISVRLLPVGLSAAQVRLYYHGFANATLWPLLHDAIEKSRFERAWWHGYQGVNAVFANTALTALGERPGALAWVHDYHLMLVPRLIREQRPDQPIGFFLHVPWPPPDIFARLPWRQDILFGLLGADVVSFHTEQYRRNFIRAFSRLATDPATDSDIAALNEQFAGRTLLLGVDRLDYTKGIVERVLAVEMLLERRADLHSKLAFLQIAVPSRDSVPEYRNLRGTVERHIGRINGQFTEPGSDVPVHYLYRGLPQQQLAAYYASAASLLVTPLIDGMNLVAKEYVTVQHARRGSGSLVLSEFTGAAVELREAVPCNPFDVEGLSYRIERALELPASIRRNALATMARRIRGHDVYQWVARQLAEIESRGASPLPAFSARPRGLAAAGKGT